MLDQFAASHFTALRLAESSWGNLQTAPTKFAFDWLKQALDDVHARGMSAILGTSTYIAPQWLVASHPDMLRQLQPGIPVHSMGRKAACINHPLYREACRTYISAIAKDFKDHPAVVGWQLDNEIEFTMGQVCYNRACEDAWQRWLTKTYGTAAELNRRWDLTSWGMRVESFEEIPQAYQSVDPAGIRQIPILTLANWHFQRDTIFDFFADQKRVLREAGASQWITTDWNDVWASLGDDPGAEKTLDVEGLNYYPGPDSTAEYWKNMAWEHDLHRSGRGGKSFLITETTAGVYGGTSIGSAAPTREEFRMWALQPVAFGASGLLYWSSNAWRGGPWPQWGSLMDWSGKPETELSWAKELGELFGRWGSKLGEAGVQSDIAVINDFDQRAVLATYPETSSSQTILTDVFHFGHRLGLGVDSVNTKRAGDVAVLRRYRFVILAADCALDNEAVTLSLLEYAGGGGQIFVTPINGYQTWDGIFVEGALGSRLHPLTGTVVEATRRTALQPEGGRLKPVSSWSGPSNEGPVTVALDGFWEKLAIDADVEVVAHFRASDPSLDGNPSVTRKRVGKGSVVKLAFWPKESDAFRLFQTLCVAKPHGLLSEALVSEVQGVPRIDGSLFLVNTGHTKQVVRLGGPAQDRFTNQKVNGALQLEPFAVSWLEPIGSSR